MVVYDYHKVDISGTIVRFAESVIRYCPFCGKKIKLEGDE